MIEIEALQFRYRKDGEEIFAGLGHKFAPGRVATITGASGRGKSTLLYLIGLLLTPDSGRVLIDGANTGGLSDGSRARLRARRIGFVFQDAALDVTRSVLDNVVEGGIYAGMSRRAAEKRAAGLLDRFGVELRGDHRPGEVSGGQAQRVGLCRALIKDPTIVLADEPTGNLDQESAAVVLDALFDTAAGGATVLIASHDPQVTARGTDVLGL